ncbi:unnamed protein product [Blepharisma stoltei]|uniref:Uncharacterized protein n=1 Tax=Blepharisma stoltei TaxID=1481888 RepID=A0AAU9K5Z8_9CILI|nr:unnamed protein product [Blepharisma stoltei]
MTLQALKDCIYCLSDFITFNTNNGQATFTIEGKNMYLNTKLEDLTVAIGKPYTYKHRLQCHHFMIFNDVKLISQEDPQYRSAYPYQKFCSKTKRQICEICQNFHAKFVCVNDIMLDKSICYMCETCFRDLHYSENGERLYQDFEVYPYIHD